MDISWIELAIYSLATFRLAVLISEDKLPWNLGSKFRGWLTRTAKKKPAVRKSAIAQGVQCTRCSSCWVAAVLALLLLRYNSAPVIQWFVLVLALSGAAILLNRFRQ